MLDLDRVFHALLVRVVWFEVGLLDGLLAENLTLSARASDLATLHGQDISPPKRPCFRLLSRCDLSWLQDHHRFYRSLRDFLRRWHYSNGLVRTIAAIFFREVFLHLSVTAIEL